MKKNYILDTNVLLHDPNSVLSFKENRVIIPIEVIEEVDRFKKETSELGHNARRISRMLDNFRSKGNLSEGIPLPRGGVLQVIFHDKSDLDLIPFGNGKVDNHILAQAMRIKNKNKRVPTILISKDVNLRIKADAIGLKAEDYETDRVHLTDLYTGIIERTVTSKDLEVFRQHHALEVPAGQYNPNEYVMLRDEKSPNNTSLARINDTANGVQPLIPFREGVYGIRPKNREQYFALDALMDDRIQLVTIMGKAGTGKTLLALAAGLQKVMREHVYKRLLICRPTFPVGKEIGFLPGSLEEKMQPWMQPIHDSLELLTETGLVKGKSQSCKEWIENGTISLEPITYIRGRSINNQFIIIDEAQNLTPLEVKTVITRVGHRTKIILTGDPYQIDNPYIDSHSNGFNYIILKFREQKIAAHIEMQKGERSELAELAANLL